MLPILYHNHLSFSTPFFGRNCGFVQCLSASPIEVLPQTSQGSFSPPKVLRDCRRRLFPLGRANTALHRRIIYFDKSIFLTASLTFRTYVGDTESSSMPILRKLSVSVVSAASSPHMPIHFPCLWAFCAANSIC